MAPLFALAVAKHVIAKITIDFGVNINYNELCIHIVTSRQFQHIIKKDNMGVMHNVHIYRHRVPSSECLN